MSPIALIDIFHGSKSASAASTTHTYIRLFIETYDTVNVITMRVLKVNSNTDEKVGSHLVRSGLLLKGRYNVSSDSSF